MIFKKVLVNRPVRHSHLGDGVSLGVGLLTICLVICVSLLSYTVKPADEQTDKIQIKNDTKENLSIVLAYSKQEAETEKVITSFKYQTISAETTLLFSLKIKDYTLSQINVHSAPLSTEEVSPEDANVTFKIFNDGKSVAKVTEQIEQTSDVAQAEGIEDLSENGDTVATPATIQKEEIVSPK